MTVATPVAVAAALGPTAREALPRLGDTLLKALLGYALAVGLGVLGGLWLGSRRFAHAVAMPYVVAAYGVPKVLVLPWIVLICGLGTTTAVLTATLFAVFPILLMVAAGARDGLVLVGRRDLRSNNSWMHNLVPLVRGARGRAAGDAGWRDELRNGFAYARSAPGVRPNSEQ